MGKPHTKAFMVYPQLTDTANISISQGVELLGFGFGYLEYYDFNHTVMTINNDYSTHLTPTNYPGFNFAVARNDYITIQVDVGDPPITDVTFHTVNPCGDAFTIDYIALKYPDSPAPVPEPSTWLLFCFGMIGFVGFKKIKIKKG